MAGRPKVHQVLATLGYGDAIGHEVFGIRRALRAAGFDSEIIVETSSCLGSGAAVAAEACARSTSSGSGGGSRSMPAV